MKICLVSHSSEVGAGAERSLLTTVEGLRERGAECLVVVPEDGPLSREFRTLNVQVAVLPYVTWLGPWYPRATRVKRLGRNLHAAWQLAGIVRSRGFDLVYTNTMVMNVGAIAALFARRPHIWHIREFGWEDHGVLYELGEKLSLRIADMLTKVFVTNSQAVADKYARFIPPTKLRTVYQGVEVLSAPLPAGYERNKAYRCVLVGALHEGKKQEDAVRAVASLREAGMEIELLLVGGGRHSPYVNLLEGLVDELRLKDCVRFTGAVGNSFPFMESADVVLVCSRCEAFGRVTIEGMLAGKPVIATSSGGTPELIEDNVTGLLYEPGNDDELAAKIEWLHDHASEASNIGARAKSWATDRFTTKQYRDEIFDILSAAGA
ncbi:MAG: glycosyltransferase [Verrucomicrobia bacterium]|nr:glycosyltransferase [Verrucomicrobiota bacterium]